MNIEDSDGLINLDSLDDFIKYSTHERDLYFVKRGQKDILTLNANLRLLDERLKFEQLDCLNEFSKQRFITFKRIYKHICEESFDWVRLEPEVQSQLNTIGTPLRLFSEDLDSLFVFARPIQTLFPLNMLSKFLEIEYTRAGYFLYDIVMRIRSDFMTILTQFHLKSDTKFNIKLDSTSMKMMDPFMRIHIRQANRADPLIREKYLSENFNIKNFIKTLIDSFFPNMTWRYVGDKAWGQYWLLHLTKFTFELGLWEYRDLNDFLLLLFTKLDSLCTLENATIIDIKADRLNSFPDYMIKMAQLLLLCREEVSEICVHVAVLINDHVLEGVLNSKTTTHTESFSQCIDRVFFNDNHKSEQIYSVITRFLIKPNRIEDVIKPELLYSEEMKKSKSAITERYSVGPVQRNLVDLFHFITDANKDIWMTSMKFNNQFIVDFYAAKDPRIPLLLEEAIRFRIGMIDLYNEFVSCNPEEGSELTPISRNWVKLLNILKRSLDTKEEANDGSKELFNYCLALANIPKILLTCAQLVQSLMGNYDIQAEKETFTLPLVIITDIADNCSSQCLLVGRVGWRIFENLIASQPLLTVILIDRIFRKDNKIFYGQNYLFNIIADIYEKIIEDVVDDLIDFEGNTGWKYQSLVTDQPADPGQAEPPSETAADENPARIPNKIGKIISLIIYNKCLTTLLSVHSEREEMRFYDLIIQKKIGKFFCYGILKHILSGSLTEEGTMKIIQDLNFKEYDSTLQFSNKREYKLVEVKTLLFEMAVSTLKLFAKSTVRVYTDQVYLDFIAVLPDFDRCSESLNYLSTFKQGVRCRAAMLDLINNMMVFPVNQLICPRPNQSMDEIKGFCEILFSSDDLSPYRISEFIVKEFDFLFEWSRVVKKEEIDNMKVLLQNYVFRSLLPLVYKFVNGVLSLITVSYANISSSNEVILQYIDSVKEISSKFDVFAVRLKEEFEITLSKSMVDGFLSMFGGFGSPADGLGSLGGVDLGGINLLGAADDKVGKAEDQKPPAEVEEGVPRGSELDEMLNKDLYELRSMCKKICRTIEESTPEEFTKYITLYRRKTALKKKYSKMDELSFMKRNKDLTVFKSEDGQEAIEKASDIIQDEDESTYNQVKALTSLYEMRKSEWISKDRKDNSFYRFLSENNSAREVFTNYWIDSLTYYFTAGSKPEAVKKGSFQEQGEKESKESLRVRKLLIEQWPLSLLSFLETISKIVDNGLITIIDSVIRKRDGIAIEMVSPIDLLHDVILCLTPFCLFKTFQDHNHKSMADLLEHLFNIWCTLFNPKDREVKGFFFEAFSKNIVKDDSKSYEKVTTNTTSMVNTVIRLLHRALFYMEVAHLVNIPTVVMSERPETYQIVTSLIQILSELVNGSNVQAQGLVYGFNLDVYLGLVNRVVDDINSPFYRMKLEAIFYFKYLSEELPEGDTKDLMVDDAWRGDKVSAKELKSRICSIIATNLSPSSLDRLIIRLIKKLFIYVKSISSPSFKEELITSIKQQLEEKRVLKEREKAKLIAIAAKGKQAEETDIVDLYEVQSSNLVKIDTEIKQIEQKLIKLEDLSTTFSEFEDKKAIVLREMEDSVIITDYEKLLEYYKISSEFSNHLLLTICAEMVELMDVLAKNNDSFRANVSRRIKLMYTYFGDEVPKSLLREGRIETTRIKRQPESKAPEEVIIFMFLAKIMTKIEVCIPIGDKNDKKTIQFCMHPLSFYLSSESKKTFLDNVEPSKMVETLNDSFNKFVIEMNHNAVNRKLSPFFYYATLHDNLTRQRYFIWYMSLVMNLMLAFSLRTTDDDKDEYLVFGELTFKIFGVAIAVYSFIVFLLWIMGRYRQNVDISKETIRRRNLGKTTFSMSEYFHIYLLDSFLQKTTSIQLLQHIAFGFMGAFLHPFFHSLHLLTIILMSKTASYVVRSITKNFNQLSVTFILSLFIIYSYSFIIFENYKDRWDGQVNSDGAKKMCYDLWECLFYVTNLGFRNGGGISDSMDVEATANKNGFVLKTLFDLTFFMFINIISLNIIFGIIIDTFALMRDELQQRLCKRERDDIESTKYNQDNYYEDFKYHVSHNHDIWKYLHYRLYLSKKEKSDFTGIEDAIYNKISESKLDWIPSFVDDPIENIKETQKSQDSMLATIHTLLSQIHTKLHEKPPEDKPALKD